MATARIKKGDKVMVIAGKDKEKSGKVKKVDFEKQRVIVEKLNIIKRHTKPGMGTQGGILEKEASIHLSNVMMFCDKCDKPVRIGFKTLTDKSKVRFCKSCNELLDK
ncbi:MAG: 50S ribosomal protein L24 [Deltaproteobacteria bacterium]|nr:50S ribosomal protein L24 [Candidatus Anaeroferrophillus wilburensis]MBN2889531.1 50S ribosomal protein L24 [Deltaproteobacteria bacterium]